MTPQERIEELEAWRGRRVLWTEESTAQAAKLWAEGHSASRIAKLMGEGRTRNAIIGRIHRMGLAARAAPSDPAKRAAYPKSRASSKNHITVRKQAKPLPPAALPRDASKAKPWDQIVAGECARPIGEPARPAEQLACGNPTGKEGRDWQYCPACLKEMTTRAYGSYTPQGIEKAALWAARRFG